MNAVVVDDYSTTVLYSTLQNYKNGEIINHIYLLDTTIQRTVVQYLLTTQLQQYIHVRTSLKTNQTIARYEKYRRVMSCHGWMDGWTDGRMDKSKGGWIVVVSASSIDTRILPHRYFASWRCRA